MFTRHALVPATSKRPSWRNARSLCADPCVYSLSQFRGASLVVRPRIQSLSVLLGDVWLGPDVSRMRSLSRVWSFRDVGSSKAN